MDKRNDSKEYMKSEKRSEEEKVKLDEIPLPIPEIVENRNEIVNTKVILNLNEPQFTNNNPKRQHLKVHVTLKKQSETGKKLNPLPIEISQIQSLSVGKKEMANTNYNEKSDGVDATKGLFFKKGDLSLSNPSQVSFMTPLKQTLEQKKPLEKTPRKNIRLPNLLEKIQMRRTEESKKLPRPPTPFFSVDSSSYRNSINSLSHAKYPSNLQHNYISKDFLDPKAMLSEMKKRNKTDTEVWNHQNKQNNTSYLKPPMSLSSASGRGLNKGDGKNQISEGSHSSYLLNLLNNQNSKTSSNQNDPKNLPEILLNALTEAIAQSPQIGPKKIQTSAGRPRKQNKGELYNNSSIATISEQYSKENLDESQEKQSRNTFSQPNKFGKLQLIDLKKRNLTDIRGDLKRDSNIEDLFNQEKSSIINKVADEKKLEEGDCSDRMLGDEFFLIDEKGDEEIMLQ